MVYLFISYFDESGDDGFPKYSSPIFLLTSIYMPHVKWKENYNKITEGRRQLKDKYGFPVKLEFHTKYLLTNKNPYRQYGWSDQQRHDIIFDLFQIIADLDVKIINVAIIKNNIKRVDYNVLDAALTYNVQRIENDLSRLGKPDTNFLIITDEGRMLNDKLPSAATTN